MVDNLEGVEVLEPVAPRKEGNEFLAVGRRKEASARVRLKPGTGQFIVNGRPIAEYLARDTLVRTVMTAFEPAGGADKYDVRARVTGGGKAGQAGALRLAVARALLSTNPELRKALRSEGLLTRDAREVERKKYGQPGARKRFQFSKR